MNLNKLTLPFLLLGLLIVSLLYYSFTTTKEDSTYTVIAPPHWENLKVLPQDISKDSLFGLMKGYSKSLGVQCNFCHVPKEDDPKKLDFPKDSKIQKEIARGMITMTNEINENYFKPHYPDPKPTQVSDVQCIMCHRGNSNPEEYLGDVGTFYQPKKREKGEH